MERDGEVWRGSSRPKLGARAVGAWQLARLAAGVVALTAPLAVNAALGVRAGAAPTLRATQISLYSPPPVSGGPSAPVVSVVVTSTSAGAWEAASNGAVYASGNATDYGSMAGHRLAAPVVGMATTKSGRGYWLVASDGGIFSFGDAAFHGSMGGRSLNQPIVGVAADPATGGYWEVASDGGIFAFDAPFYGSSGGSGAGGTARVTSFVQEDDGHAYLWCAADSICEAASATSSVSGHAIVPPANPPANVAPAPTFQYAQSGSTPGACWADVGGAITPAFTRPACVTTEVAATDHARALEGLPGLRLPSNYLSLTPAEQLLVLTDLERVSRGEQPVLGLSSGLDADAQQGADANTDPGFSGLSTIHTWQWAGSNWGASRSSLDVDYYWMYLDGWAGTNTSNLACTSPQASGCWAHRDNILEPSSILVMGAGEAANNWNGYASYAEVIVSLRSSADVPPLYYTWADAVAAGAAS